MPERGAAVGIMANQIPMERFPETVARLFPLLGNDDRENMTLIWQAVMPTPAFDQAKLMIQKAIGDEWADLLKRIPTLA